MKKVPIGTPDNDLSVPTMTANLSVLNTRLMQQLQQITTDSAKRAYAAEQEYLHERYDIDLMCALDSAPVKHALEHVRQMLDNDYWWQFDNNTYSKE